MTVRRFLLYTPILLIIFLLQSYFWIPTFDQQPRGNPHRLIEYINASIGDASLLNPILSADASSGDQTGDDCPVVVADEDCDTRKRPFVFVHGTYGSGDNIANVAMLFGSNGYCQDRFVAIEYNSLDFENEARTDQITAKIDDLVDKILEETGADKVELAGHSQGTGHCKSYLSDPDRAAKVAHYINYSGSGEVPAGIPTLALSSDNDGRGAGPAFPPESPDVLDVNIGEEDHFAVAASRDAFIETWKFLYGEEPEYTTIQCGQDPGTPVDTLLTSVPRSYPQ